MTGQFETSKRANLPLPNTLALPARAERALFAASVAELQAALIANAGAPVLVLGSGSNVVLPDVVSDLTVLMRIMGIREVVEQSPTGSLDCAGLPRRKRVFEVGAGESWQGFIRFCLGQGLGGGIENLTLIPGTVGAAPIQNIGAYGVEVAEFVSAVQVLDANAPDLPPIWMARSECHFGYRDSVFKRQPGRWVITCVRFALVSGAVTAPRLEYAGVSEQLERMGCTRLTPATVSEAIARLRRSKLPDPRRHPNAGSFFKNPQLSNAQFERLLNSLSATAAHRLEAVPRWPQDQGVKLAAAALIERAGCKVWPGKQVRIWYRQPLVLVTDGNATAVSLSAYAQEIRLAVHEQFGITLEQEPVQVASHATLQAG